MPINVAITDDHPLAITGLQNMLSTHQGITVVAAYETGTDLLNNLPAILPDVLLLDIELPDYKGYDLAEIIRTKFPSVKMLAITSHDAPLLVKRMMQHGCSGYVLKNTRVKELVFAIEQVYRGEEYIAPSLREQMMYHTKIKTSASKFRVPVLSQREKEILQLIVQEYTNQEIADKLFISLRTVENHRFSLLQKLDVKNAIGLARVALQLGLVEQ